MENSKSFPDSGGARGNCSRHRYLRITLDAIDPRARASTWPPLAPFPLRAAPSTDRLPPSLVDNGEWTDADRRVGGVNNLRWEQLLSIFQASEKQAHLNWPARIPNFFGSQTFSIGATLFWISACLRLPMSISGKKASRSRDYYKQNTYLRNKT